MRSVTANSFVELIACDAKLFRPAGDVGCHLWIDLLRIMWPFYMLFMYGVGLARVLRRIVMLYGTKRT
jgi:hypothetical protein